MTSSKSQNNKLKSVFITGTDTGVGKTVVTGLLGHYLLKKGYNVTTQKWIQTGSMVIPDDIKEHLDLMGKNIADIREHLVQMCSYMFKFPASPHLAARMEKRKIHSAKIKSSFGALSQRSDCVLVEGIGGALVPYNNQRYVVDIAAQLKLPVVVVASNKLGAINHIAMTIEVLKKRGMKILGIIFNNMEISDTNIIKDNPRVIKTLTGQKILGQLSFSKDKDKLYQSFAPIGQKLLSQLR